MKRMVGIVSIAAAVIALVSATTVKATTWMVTFDRLNDLSTSSPNLDSGFLPTDGYSPAAAAGAIDATGKWNVFNPDTRGGNVFNGSSGTYGANYFNGAAYYGDSAGVPLYDVTGGSSVKWKIATGSVDTSMWLPRYGVAGGNPPATATNFQKITGNNGPGSDGKGIGGNDGARDYTIQLSGLTAGNTFNAYMFGFWKNYSSQPNTMTLSLNGAAATTFYNSEYTDSLASPGGVLVSGLVPVGGIVTLRATTNVGFFSPALVFDSGAGAVPEPSTLMLLGLGGLSLIGVARRMRK